MKISTTTDYLSQCYGDEKALEMLAQAGYEAVDYSMFIFPEGHWVHTCSQEELVEYYRGLLAHARKAGIRAGQLHAPFGPYPDSPEKRERYENQARRAILAAGALECPYVVVHPLICPYCLYDQGHERAKEENMGFYVRLMPLLKEQGVQLGVENMFSRDPETKKICPTVVSRAEEMADYIDTLNGIAGEELFVACLDIGHGSLIQGESPERMIGVLGDRLRLLHVQDTDGKNDLHTIPYMGSAVNWDNVCQALKRVKYQGTFNFEADCFIRRFPKALLPQACALQCALGRELVSRIEE